MASGDVLNILGGREKLVRVLVLWATVHPIPAPGTALYISHHAGELMGFCKIPNLLGNRLCVFVCVNLRENVV